MEIPYYKYKEKSVENTTLYDTFADLFLRNFGCLRSKNFVFAIENTNNAIQIKKKAVV